MSVNPKRPQPSGDEELVAHAIMDEAHRRAQQIAAMVGPAPNTEPLSPRDEADRWNARSPKVSLEQTQQLAQMALQQIVAEHQQQGNPVPDPEQLTLAVAAKVNGVIYPWRRALTSRGFPRITEQIERAEQLQKIAEKYKRPDVPQPSYQTVAPAALPAPEPTQSPRQAPSLPDLSQMGAAAVAAPQPTPTPTPQMPPAMGAEGSR